MGVSGARRDGADPCRTVAAAPGSAISNVTTADPVNDHFE